MMRKIVLLICLFFVFISPCLAVSPDNEVWIYRVVLDPNINVTYAFKEGDTYLQLYDENFYKIPCEKYTGGSVCAGYGSNYAWGWQKIDMSYGLLLGYFPSNMAVEFSGYGILPIVMMFDLEKVGNVEDYPSDAFKDAEDLPDKYPYIIH
jgi:hypothetical protein